VAIQFSLDCQDNEVLRPSDVMRHRKSAEAARSDRAGKGGYPLTSLAFELC
jgi:hypothetical protein